MVWCFAARPNIGLDFVMPVSPPGFDSATRRLRRDSSPDPGKGPFVQDVFPLVSGWRSQPSGSFAFELCSVLRSFPFRAH